MDNKPPPARTPIKRRPVPPRFISPTSTVGLGVKIYQFEQNAKSPKANKPIGLGLRIPQASPSQRSKSSGTRAGLGLKLDAEQRSASSNTRPGLGLKSDPEQRSQSSSTRAGLGLKFDTEQLSTSSHTRTGLGLKRLKPPPPQHSASSNTPISPGLHLAPNRPEKPEKQRAESPLTPVFPYTGQTQAEEEQEMREKGLKKFTADEYAAEIQGLWDRTFAVGGKNSLYARKRLKEEEAIRASMAGVRRAGG